MNRKARSLMVLKGVTNRQIASSVHVTETWVSLVATGKRRSDRVRAAIAKAVGKRVDDLWPSWPSKKSCLGHSTNFFVRNQ